MDDRHTNTPSPTLCSPETEPSNSRPCQIDGGEILEGVRWLQRTSNPRISKDVSEILAKMTKAYLKRGKLIEARTVEMVYQRLSRG